MIFCEKDRAILRALAAEQMEIANSAQMKDLEKLWYDHNDVKGVRPLVKIETDTFAQEIIDPRLQCTEESARNIEKALLANIVNTKLFGDDTFVNPFFTVKLNHRFKPFNITIDRDESGGLGHHFVSHIVDLEDDFEKLTPSTFAIETIAQAEKRIEPLQDLFGDILPVKLTGGCMYSVPTQDIVHIMSMEDLYIAMMDYPELVKKMMNNLCSDYMRFYKELEKQTLLLSTTYSEALGQGTYCFTKELPVLANTTKDLWVFMDSQETTGISPDMYEEFIFPAYKSVFENFGLFSYGCCEAVDPIWEKCLSKVPHLRKVSISPWCNEEYMGEQLKGTKTIYHRKPSPNFLGVTKEFDEDAFRAHIAKSIKAANGCEMEITQRDVYTVHHDINKVKRYVEIVREEYSK